MRDERRGELLYEGKAKRLYATDDPGTLVVEYKDDATAFNAQKRGTISGKGAVNNAVTARIFQYLESAGVPTHLVAVRAGNEQLVRRVAIVPLEVIVRNRAAGSFAQRYGVAEGGELDPVVIEWCYKNDALGDPFINDAAAVALGFATVDGLEEMFELAVQINEALKALFDSIDLVLVDFKIEFGRSDDGELMLADEISPDTCRLWDASSGEKLDKDRFRRDLGGVEEAYQEVLERVQNADLSAALAAYRAHAPQPGHVHADEAAAGGDSDRGAGQLRATVDVMLKRSILDPQGRAVEATLRRLGHGNVENVRVGKRIELSVSGERHEVEEQLANIAETVLSNPVMETFEIEMLEPTGEG